MKEFNFFGKLKVNEETVIRLMIYEIREKNPDSVKFVPTPGDVKSILLYMKTRNYNTIMYIYGHRFLLEILNMFEDHENFEECEEIVKQIKTHNEFLKDNLPTKID
jgi:hypothetical protein